MGQVSGLFDNYELGTKIRAATELDLAAFRYVGFATWPATYQPFAGAEYVVENLDRWWSREALLPSIAANDCLVATHRNDVVGVSEVGELGDDIVMWKLYVLPQWQGQGVGKQLLRAVVRLAEERNLPLVTEYVAANALAGAFYASQGFKAESVPANPMDSIWMRLRV